jgi:hypothetical protein
MGRCGISNEKQGMIVRFPQPDRRKRPHSTSTPSPTLRDWSVFVSF